MPCNSDYLQRSTFEAELQRAAKLLIYVRSALNLPIGSWLAKAARDYYGKGGDQAVIDLCSIMKRLPTEKRNQIVGAKNRDAADLNLWWIEHQLADAARERSERDEVIEEILRQRGLSKLTPEERRVLGV